MKEKKLTKRQKKMIKTHKERMYHLRVFNEDWELIHQKRWDDDTLCFEDKCDCEEENMNMVGFQIGT